LQNKVKLPFISQVTAMNKAAELKISSDGGDDGHLPLHRIWKHPTIMLQT
jgi:hypothetical protein